MGTRRNQAKLEATTHTLTTDRESRQRYWNTAVVVVVAVEQACLIVCLAKGELEDWITLLTCSSGHNSIELRENLDELSSPSATTIAYELCFNMTTTTTNTSAASNSITTRATTFQTIKESTGLRCAIASKGRRGLFHCLSRRALSEILILLLCIWPLAGFVETTSSDNGSTNGAKKESPSSINFTARSTTTTTTNSITPAIAAGDYGRTRSKRFYNDESRVAAAKSEPPLDPLGAPMPLASSSDVSSATQATALPAKADQKANSEPNRSYGRRKPRKKSEKKVRASGGNVAAGDNEERAMRKDVVSKAIKKVHKKNKKLRKKLHKLAHKTKHNLHQLVHSVHG